MMEDTCGYDEVEITAERARLLQRHAIQVEILQAISLLEIFVVIQRGFADINGLHMSLRIGERNDSCLVRTTPRNQNIKIRTVFPIWPENPMCMRWIEPLPISLQPGRKIENRLGVHPALVLLRDNIR
jgi:hypothetical protein